ncbi:hypothetical protein BJV74DRAFT_829865 [Russula compacta]|nr:hypothetical protein BJV74DRAFT_829865 [Russula compacta]
MSDQVSLQVLPIQPHEFDSLPAGFEYEHEISEASNTIAFDTGVDARDLRRCVVCSRNAAGGPHPGVTRARVIGKTEDVLWAFLKRRRFVPSFAKSVVHEPRNSISLCDSHHSDFDGYRFSYVFSYYQQVCAFVFVNFSRTRYLEQFHGKVVVLDADHKHSPFPAPFLIQEMRTRGFHPWCTDRPIPHPRSTTYTLDDGGAASSNSEPLSTESNQQYLVLNNPFQDPELLESMRRQWQQLPNWKSATVEGLNWEGTGEENARKYIDLVGVGTH